MKIGYLIPEFPGQTHIWIWREICHMREWGISIHLFSTKRPSPDIKARHGFAKLAEDETYYLWKPSIREIIKSIFWAIFTSPLGLIKSIWLALKIDIDTRYAFGVKIRLLHLIPLVLIACIFAREAKKQGIEHLHCHSCANSAIIAMMLKRMTSIPYSLTLNANLEWWGGGLASKFADADFTIAITEWLLEEVRKNYPNLRPEQLILGGIGVDTTKWVPIHNNEFKIKDNSFQVVTVSRLHPSKGHDTLIRAIKQLIDAGKVVKLNIIGTGSELGNLKVLVNQLNLSEFIDFTGSLSEDQIIEQMQQADAFVLASHAEPLGVVYMEAMAMEVPTIGTNAGGVAEIITNNHDGLLVPPRDDTMIANALTLLIENPQLRLQLGRNGRETIVQRFDSRIGAATLYNRLKKGVGSRE
jgi:colanic acid/amylovoran biosynthesis glycosyltransferase